MVRKTNGYELVHTQYMSLIRLEKRTHNTQTEPMPWHLSCSSKTNQPSVLVYGNFQCGWSHWRKSTLKLVLRFLTPSGTLLVCCKKKTYNLMHNKSETEHSSGNGIATSKAKNKKIKRIQTWLEWWWKRLTLHLNTVCRSLGTKYLIIPVWVVAGLSHKLMSRQCNVRITRCHE